MRPPKEDRPPHHQEPIHQTEPHQEARTCKSSRFDDLANRARRRDAAVRLEGGDPELPSRRYHRSSAGLRASGFREGYSRGTRETLNRIWPLLDADARQAAQVIISELQEAA